MRTRWERRKRWGAALLFPLLLPPPFPSPARQACVHLFPVFTDIPLSLFKFSLHRKKRSISDVIMFGLPGVREKKSARRKVAEQRKEPLGTVFFHTISKRLTCRLLLCENNSRSSIFFFLAVGPNQNFPEHTSPLKVSYKKNEANSGPAVR